MDLASRLTRMEVGGGALGGWLILFDVLMGDIVWMIR